jgi:hypothetical protein
MDQKLVLEIKHSKSYHGFILHYDTLNLLHTHSTHAATTLRKKKCKASTQPTLHNLEN